MGKLIYSAIASLDGYTADEAGNFEWAAPDEEVHAAVNDMVRSAGTHLYGRREYEVLVPWETMGTEPDEPEVVRDFAALWRAADKIVYSTTLAEPQSARTRIERRFDPGAVRDLKASVDHDLTIAGPTLAAQAFAEGLVDEVHLFLHPIAVGGGLAALPRGAVVRLALERERRFASGVVQLAYRVVSD